MRHEPALRARLTELDRVGRTSYAAACGELLVPLHRRGSEGAGAADPLDTALAELWRAVDGRGSDDLKAHLSRLEGLVPTEDVPGWTVDDGYAENAVAAVAYAIETWLHDSVDAAVWAARQVHEAADLAAQHGDAAGVDLGTPWAENRLLASPTVHAALASLDHLLGAVEGPRTSTEEVREQARTRGASVAAAYPGRGRGGSPS